MREQRGKTIHPFRKMCLTRAGIILETQYYANYIASHCSSARIPDVFSSLPMGKVRLLFLRVLDQHKVGGSVAAHQSEALAIGRPLVGGDLQRGEIGDLAARTAVQLLQP